MIRKVVIMTAIFLMLVGCSRKLDTTRVYCPECRVHVYNYDNKLISENKLINKGFTAEKIFWINRYKLPKREIICPICEEYLNGWEYWGSKQGFKSFKLTYPAMSLLTKENEKWVWVPMDMPLLEIK